MTKLDQYLYDMYSIKMEYMKGKHVIMPEVGEGFSKINDCFSREEYMTFCEALANDIDDQIFDGYKYGFKDGIKFLISMITD